MPRRPVLVTTSWDDGHRLDTSVAAELDRHGIAGTFYVAPRSVELAPEDRLDPTAVRELSQRFEIGSHTLTHPHLTRLAPEAARAEIVDGKAALEDVLGDEVTSFCYPYGAFDPGHVTMVREVGFSVGRTIRRFDTATAPDPLQMRTSAHAARYRRDALPVLRRSRRVGDPWRLWANWDVLARSVFEEARAGGGVFHLWGHSWEIDAHGDRHRLRSLLEFLAGQDDVEFVTNGELMRRSVTVA